MSNPRIAYLASEYPAVSHTFIFREVRALRADSFEVVTASIRRPGHLDRMTSEEQSDADTTFYIKNAPLGRVVGAHGWLSLTQPAAYIRMLARAFSLAVGGRLGLAKALAYFGEAGLLVHWMKRERAGHIHVHFANPAATVALIASASNLVSFSLSIHGPDVFYNEGQNLLAEKVMAAAFTRCISFYCQSQVMKLLPVEEWNRLHIVRCGVPLDAYRPREDPQNSVPEILCVGRLVPVKGQHVLLESCRDLKEQGIDFHLTYVGDGPDRVSLESRCRALGMADAVTFAGAVGQGEIHAYYDRADVFVLATFGEGLPVVLMEAMAKGVASISTYVAAIPELIHEGENGFLVSPSDGKALARQLTRLLEDPDLRMEIGRKARGIIEENYDVERNCLQMASLFRKYWRA